MTSVGKTAAAALSKDQGSIGKYASAFGLSLGITSLFNALLVVVKETNEDTVLAWMKAATGHHWVTHGIIDLVVFVVLGFALARIGESWRARPNAVIAVAFGGIALGALGIVGFFL